MKVKLKEINPEIAGLVDQVLDAVGLSEEWLNAGKESFLDGRKLHNFSKGEDLILEHINNRIGILVDTDTDGYTSASMMYQWLKDKNPNAEIEILIQEGKVHGIMPKMFEDKDFDLLIIPDAGSGQIKEQKALKEKGYDILILDHHEMGEESEYAVVINPHNQNCHYENKALSGGAVVYKFIEGVDTNRGELDYSKYIDLAAVSIISDMMSIKSLENKAIVNIGLANLINPYFKAAFKADQRLQDKNFDPIAIAFYIVPVINGTIRMGEQEDKMNLFLALSGIERPEPIIAGLLKIRNKQNTSKEPIITRICYNLQKNGLDQGKIIFAETPKNTPKALTGLIAGQIANLYNRPVLLGRPDDNGNYVGSLRSINDSTVENLKDFCMESGFFNWVEGHQAAAGYSIPVENMEKFLAYVDQELPPVEKVYSPFFDLGNFKNPGESILEIAFLNDHLATDFKEVLVYSELEITAANLRLMGKSANVLAVQDLKNNVKYIKFRHKNGINLTGFGKIFFEEKEYESGKLRIVGKCSINEWMGMIEPQIIIEDMEFIPTLEKEEEPKEISLKYLDIL